MLRIPQCLAPSNTSPSMGRGELDTIIVAIFLFLLNLYATILARDALILGIRAISHDILFKLLYSSFRLYKSSLYIVIF